VTDNIHDTGESDRHEAVGNAGSVHVHGSGCGRPESQRVQWGTSRLADIRARQRSATRWRPGDDRWRPTGRGRTGGRWGRTGRGSLIALHDDIGMEHRTR
jgi:hypothetical protein